MPDRKLGPVYQSGDCTIDLARRELRILGSPAPIGARAFEIMVILAESAGGLVTKNELMDRIWPGQIVNDNTLQAHIAALRKALGHRRAMLKTETGRGYRLLGDWSIRHDRPSEASVIPFPPSAGAIRSPPSPPAARASTGNLPVPVARLIGRSAALPLIRELLSTSRVVTLTGPGGIGKTTLALHVARGRPTSFDDESWLVELSSLSNPDLVPSAVAAALGLRLGDIISAEAVARAIGAARLLLLLDNCEHVIDAAAEMAETLIRHCPRVTILATSRETLRIEGEYVYRVPPLNVPASTVEEMGEILGHSSVELFIACAQAQGASFTADAATLPVVAEICRHLDGIPLAIEFGVARATTLGLPEVAAMLGDRFRLLTSGRRTALPRHQTLRAALDWSYDLLTEEERELLCHLAVFPAGFTLDGAAAVSGRGEPGRATVANGLASLTQKSLVVVEAPEVGSRWRLLETIRSYALDKLDEGGERERLAHRHAEYYRDLFERAKAASEMPAAEWLAEYGSEIDNLRAALYWAFSPGGDAAIGVALMVASGPLWTRLSLSDECRRLTERALSALEPGSALATRRQIQLLALLGWSLEATIGATPEMRAAFSQMRELSERIGDIKFKSLAIWGLWVYHFNNGEFTIALDLAKRSIAEEGVDPIHLLAGDRIIGLSLHYLGDQAAARRQIESLLQRPVDPLPQVHDVRAASFDNRVTLRSFLARILWLQGFPDRAMRMAEENVEDALALNHALTLANALVQAACPVAFLIGDLAAADHFVRMLVDCSTKHGLRPWQAWGRCFEGMLLIGHGDTVTGSQRLSTAVSGLRDIGYAVYYVAFMGELAAALGRSGQAAHGLATIDEALARSERSEERWVVAELLRIKGELVILQAASGAKPAAEEHFRQSLDWAHRQGALSWELRAATSLARLMLNRGQPAPAKQLLAPVFCRFTEGFNTADLREARTLLDQLG
jgi:predicted ATPase/DNA-binding winged helix-turn-helix (wHTH) protein